MKHIFVFVALLALSFTAQAQLTIEITQGVDDPTKIAVVPIQRTDGVALPEDISRIVMANLERSGLFDAIPRDNMLSFPRAENEIHFRDWRVLGTEYLLIGQVTENAGIYRVSYELFDVLGERRIMRRQVVEGSEGQLRSIAHNISDRIYETITGIRGAFDTQIIYVEVVRHDDGTDTFRLMRADADGARPVLLLESSEPILSPVWSPDGRRVAYVSFETNRPAVFVQNLATGEREQVTDFVGLNGAPAWSPDGRKLAVVLSKDGNPEIYTLELANKRLTRVTNHFAIDTEPSWTHDGKGIIFTSNRGGRPQIYQVDLASGRVERLTFQGNYNARGRLSPDGKSMVMVHQREGTFNIALQELDTGTLRLLTETQLDESPSVAPNGAMLIYSTRHRGRGVLAVVSLDAGTRYYLPSERGDVREPAWSPFFD
ncbi:Tol-Pal system beta propeller repeat protein TolB [Marinimicrobium sp. ABcell2]|nr:Tol-Pal system beta propeller repeat protein TolB [Marinimicrobium sp. ABcell2]MDQ2077898.1 Tol-Pal system beta propeller repeat protein TolB [Marinimicrobium sp. ABcell2]